MKSSRRCSVSFFPLPDGLSGRMLLLLGALLAGPCPGYAQAARTISGHVVGAARQLKPLGALPATNLSLVLGLPLRNEAELDTLLRDLHDPASTNYHCWLTPDQFTAKFGPTPEDYQKVLDFAGKQGFRITKAHSNRMMVNVDAPVTNIEKAFSLSLRQYPHPTENRIFYAPDSDPVVDTNVPIQHVAGLDNFILPHRIGPKITSFDTNTPVAYATGSSPGGYFMGSDFRKAYVPGVTNTGAGQYIAIVDVGGPYYPLDVYMYQTNAGLSTNIVVTNIFCTLTSDWTNALTGSSVDEGEEVLDIDMAMSMAPGATILNYEGDAHNVFNQIAVDNKAKQMTLSYGFGIDSTIQQSFKQFVAQGQSMSQASGDGGADLDGGTGLTGAPYSTVVGGVSLTTSGANGPWLSDVTWGGSGGGISGWGIPDWQQGINMTTNLGSTSYRNYPDVSMPADNVYLILKNGTASGPIGGTSAASPLWAGFMALVNQQAASLGKPAVGFANPAIYAIGKGPRATYTNCFHDITSGNTFNGHNATRYAAYPGYDLCTGWGSPTGSNTINALAGVGTNNFTFYPSQGTFSLVAGASARGTITMSRMNGLTGSATFSITGVPAGVTMTISPASTTNTTSLAVSTRTNTVPGTYAATLTGTLGSLTHAETINLVIVAPVPGAAQVSLAYNRTGFYTDGTSFSAGFTTGVDGSYGAYSATLLGQTVSWNGLVFNLGAANTADVVYCAGQTITLPAGRFNTLQLLAAGVQGNQTAQTFTVTYTDNSTATFTQSFSDWASPQGYPGETTALSMPYRNVSTGASESLNVSVDGYVFMLNQTNTVKSLTLPSNSDVVIFSVMLANDPVSASLASYYNRDGIYSDGTNCTTGGLDGGGYTLSGTLLGGSQTWSNTVFNFGPVNATNVLSAANQTIPLPAGNYALLRLLATAVQGSYASQSFVVTYSDGTTSTFSQSMSDWFSPQSSYAGESKAIIMGHRNYPSGEADNRAFYLYGYSFALNTAKTVQSVRLPNNANVIVAAISLVPNWPPTFGANPFTLATADAGRNYSGAFATNVSDLNGGTLTCAKVSGPAWLSVAANGTLSGVPANADANTNQFTVSVKDTGGLSNTATLFIYVNGAPVFTNNPMTLPDVVAGQNYSGNLATNAGDPNRGDTLTFAKVSGPAWLSVAASGSVSGTPLSADFGANSFVVSASDPRNLSGTATLNINVLAAPPILSTISATATNLLLNWSGGIAPYQVQVSTDLLTSAWLNFGAATNGTSAEISLSNSAAFYRIVGQ